MITTTSLQHPSMQIKIKACRTLAMMRLVGKLYNAKGKVIMVCVQHGAFEEFQEPTFYLVDKDGVVGKDVTDMVLKACPYDVYVKPKSFFGKVVASVKDVVTSVQAKAAVSISPMFVYF